MTNFPAGAEWASSSSARYGQLPRNSPSAGYSWRRVGTGVSPVTRLRGVELSLEAYRRLAVATVVMLVVIVATGATVRLTGSGLGCEHWPGCTSTVSFPEKGYHSFIEFSNRIVATLTTLVTLAAWLGARLAGVPTAMRRLALATFLGVVLQGALGAITVLSHLNPYIVLTHLLVSLAVLSVGVVLALEATALVRGRDRPALPLWVREAAFVPALALGVLVLSGTLVTAAGPHAGSILVRRLWSFQPAVYWHVRATAVFGLTFAALLVWLIRARSRHVRGAFAVLAVLAVQMLVGEIQYRTKLPWWLVLIHVTNAALVWAAMTAFVFSLWRPLRAT
jgi:cytochrome c oxidase assembly protein subunit 15